MVNKKSAIQVQTIWLWATDERWWGLAHLLHPVVKEKNKISQEILFDMFNVLGPIYPSNLNLQIIRIEYLRITILLLTKYCEFAHTMAWKKFGQNVNIYKSRRWPASL